MIQPVPVRARRRNCRCCCASGEIKIGIVIPPDFERRRIDGREAMQVIVDGSDTSVQAAARQLAQMPLDGRGCSALQGQISVLPLYNPERRSAVNVVPGLIGVILTMTLVMFTAMAIVRERERGNWNCSSPPRCPAAN